MATHDSARLKKVHPQVSCGALLMNHWFWAVDLTPGFAFTGGGVMFIHGWNDRDLGRFLTSYFPSFQAHAESGSDAMIEAQQPLDVPLKIFEERWVEAISPETAQRIAQTLQMCKEMSKHGP